MQTNNHKIVDYDAVLDAKFGKEGTSSRIEAEKKAYAFYTRKAKRIAEFKDALQETEQIAANILANGSGKHETMTDFSEAL
jgi:hypothetical protein